MTDNQKLEVRDQGVAIQSSGNVTIGMSFSEVRQLVMDLFDNNYPKLQKAAADEAVRRVEEFYSKIKEKVEGAGKRIDPEVAKTPEFQYALNAAVGSAAKTPTKETRELLSDMIAIRCCEKDNVMSQAIDDSIGIVSSLSKSQLYFMAVLHVCKSISVGLPGLIGARQHMAVIKRIIQISGIRDKISDPSKLMLQARGCLFIQSFVAFDLDKVFIETYKLSPPEGKGNMDYITENIPDYKEVKEYFELQQMRGVFLTSTGIAISLFVLERHIGKLDHKIWLF